MVIAYHVIFGAYGFWLPNDPRGSWSDFIWSWELTHFGEVRKTNTRRSVASMPHDRGKRERAKKSLKYPPVIFDGKQARAIGRGFGLACNEANYVIHACSILPEHVHLVVIRHEREVEKVVAHLKSKAAMQLKQERLFPSDPEGQAIPTVWAARCWKVFLNTADDVKRCIEYVEDNPAKEGKRRQTWSFLVPYGSGF